MVFNEIHQKLCVCVRACVILPIYLSISTVTRALFLEIYHPVGFHFNLNLAHLTLLISSSTTSLAVE
uniref:Uncharacterized protein n=1 Tax=Anguilla anguilla TaxID=7936 RepID=A0A0E9PQA7_ANGAN